MVTAGRPIHPSKTKTQFWTTLNSDVQGVHFDAKVKG